MRSVRLAVVLDCCCVLVFVVIGRASHTKGESLAGHRLDGVAVPGRAGGRLARGAGLAAAVPAVAGRGGRWLGTVALGMVLRVVAGQGTAVAFIVVALVFLGLFLLGWRLLARLQARLAARRR